MAGVRTGGLLLLLLVVSSLAPLRVKVKEDEIILPGRGEVSSSSSTGVRRRKWEATSPSPALRTTTTSIEPRITVGEQIQL